MLVSEKKDMVATKPEGRLVRLAPLDEANIYRHFEWSNDADLNRLQSELPYEEEPFGDFKRRFDALAGTDHERHFEIHAVDGPMIGVASIERINEHNRNCLIAITIGDSDHRGRGLGQDALELVLAHAFDRMEMHRVCAEAFEYNEPWRRLIETAGFTLEGTERECLFRDGRYWDKSVYGLLQDEYRAR